MSRQDQITLFNAITPQQRCDVVRTHVERWLDENRARLSTEQIEYVEGVLATLTPETYTWPKTAEQERRRDEMIARGYTLLTRQDMAFAFMPHVRPIPR